MPRGVQDTAQESPCTCAASVYWREATGPTFLDYMLRVQVRPSSPPCGQSALHHTGQPWDMAETQPLEGGHGPPPSKYAASICWIEQQDAFPGGERRQHGRDRVQVRPPRRQTRTRQHHVVFSDVFCSLIGTRSRHTCRTCHAIDFMESQGRRGHDEAGRLWLDGDLGLQGGGSNASRREGFSKDDFSKKG